MHLDTPFSIKRCHKHVSWVEIDGNPGPNATNVIDNTKSSNVVSLCTLLCCAAAEFFVFKLLVRPLSSPLQSAAS